MGGCFLGCFKSSSKSPHHRILKRKGSHEPLRSKTCPQQEVKAKCESPITIEENKQERNSSFTIRKNVSFEINVKAYDPLSVCESTKSLVKDIQDNKRQEEENLEKPKTPCYPSNHRYNNCQENDEEMDELDSQESYMDDDDSEYKEEDAFGTNDESSDDLKRSQEISSLNLREKKVVGQVLSDQDRGVPGVYVNPLLNTVDNLAQWKALKTETKTKAENKNRDVAVDASLSNWLVSTDMTIEKKATVGGIESIPQKMSVQDRSVLGALTVEGMVGSEGSISRRRWGNVEPEKTPMTSGYGNNWIYSSTRVKDIGAAFSYKGLPNSTSEVLVK